MYAIDNGSFNHALLLLSVPRYHGQCLSNLFLNRTSGSSANVSLKGQGFERYDSCFADVLAPQHPLCNRSFAHAAWWVCGAGDVSGLRGISQVLMTSPLGKFTQRYHTTWRSGDLLVHDKKAAQDWAALDAVGGPNKRRSACRRQQPFVANSQ